MSPVRPRFQINASPATLNRAKAVAYDRGLSLTEFVLQAIAKEDSQLKKLVEKDLSQRTKPGNPAKPAA
jgi:hypothetical protein